MSVFIMSVDAIGQIIMYLVQLVFLRMKEIIITKYKKNHWWSHLVDLP